MEEKPSNPWPMAGGLSALCVATLLGGVLFIATASRPQPVAAPTSFTKFSAKDGSFACDYPSGWQETSGESHGVESAAVFAKGGAFIEVSSDLTGSLMGDISKSVGGVGADLPNLPGGPDLKVAAKPPVEAVHGTGVKPAKRVMENHGIGSYEEASAQPFQSRIGDARFSEVTADGGPFTGKVHGFRATMLGTDRAVRVLCWSPESDWEKLRPAFQRVINSIGPGTGGP
jgi:hypothetical protein